MYNMPFWRFYVTIVAMETQKWRPFALFSSFKIFLSALNSIKVLGPSCKMPDILVRFQPNLEFLDRFF